MKRFLKILKMIGLTLGGIILLLIIITVAFVNLSPQFGKSPSEEQQKAFAATGHFKDGKFENLIPTTLDLGFSKGVSVTFDMLFRKGPDREPGAPLPLKKIEPAVVANRAPDIARLTWFGHSACLLEIDGKKILFDPMLGQYAGPIPGLSPKRYNEELPIEIDALPFIDAIVISHDHYDHLDHGSILKLKEKTGRFYVPLGVAAHLISWGVKPENITELDWWQEAQHDGFTFICAPARHFSGRGFSRNVTLWSSWIVKTASQQLYFSGDSGYGPHFKEIGEKYGPMDFVMMECGQYNELWKSIHMMPEETVQATLDVKGKMLLPIHWGAFTLALHSWHDPAIRVTAAAQAVNLPVATPIIGEQIMLDYKNVPQSKWWMRESTVHGRQSTAVRVK
ncbi:MBL fold metallo-hydrolase [Chryseosolibacter histidini]|nr:MBL fold metallo-hydrolase [Chryseosolibacter histidini]